MPEFKIPDFLIEMSQQMNEQPNRCTSHPFWQVRCIEFVPTADGYNEHHTEINDGECVVYRSDVHKPIQFAEYLNENEDEWFTQYLLDNDLDEEADWVCAFAEHFDLYYDELPAGLRRIAVQEIEVVVSTHLTQADAEAFISRKQHDYPPLYTYVESAYWAPQLRQLQDWIMSLTKQDIKS